MKIYRHAIKKLEDQKGVVAVIVGIMIVLLLSLVAFAVDIGYALVVRNELHNIADAAALAGARKLGSIYEGKTYDEQQSYVCDPSEIVAVVKDVASKNKAGGKNIIINDDDIVIGIWHSDTKSLEANLNQPTAVSAKARRDSSANSPITTFFARVFGIDSVNVSAKSIAGLSSASSSNQLKIPFAFKEDWFTTHDPYNTTIDLRVGGPEETAWFYLEGMTPSTGNLLDMINGTTPIPELKEGDTVRINQGTKGENAYDALVTRFDEMRLINDPAQGDSDGDPSTWTMTAAVTDDSGKIVGFTTITIKSVTGPPPYLILTALPTGFTEGRGGGGGGTTMGMGTIPGFFQ